MAYKMPTIKQLPSGKWNMSKQVTLHNGEKIRKSFTSSTTNKTEARKELNNQLIKWLTINDNDKKETIRKDHERIKYKDMLELYEANKKGVEPSTKLGYIVKIRAFITRNKLTDKRIATTTTKELRNLINNEIDNGVIKSKNNLNAYKVALKSFYDYAIMQNKLDNNPIRNLDGINKIKNIKNQELNYYTIEELNIIFDELKNLLQPQFYRFYKTLLLTGLRISELCALTVDNIDLDKRTIRIESTLSQGADGYYMKKGTKTGKNRTLLMDDLTYTIIMEQLESIKISQGYTRSITFRKIFLYQQKTGEPHKGDNLTTKWTTAMKKVKSKHPDIESLTTHKLRHTYATLNLIDNPQNLMNISKILGHESLSTTMIYINQIKDNNQTLIGNSVFMGLNNQQQIDGANKSDEISNKIDNQKNTTKQDNIVKFQKLG
ncbi:tyrosine-type recombinase/integrase [Trichococcus shcherbakoviae]|uniref:Phage integrase family n=1 Tax=Trichococcus shcherbakoviae TaxID=2094020 RepID=A0A383TFH5_9LACT|nr:site-specific integrase [Trichococcus shcherbakoviae]SYZ78706.1 phage integrase family [Trichococcus shcherbakoviae]